MPNLVPTVSVYLSRPNKAKRKDKDGNVAHERITPKIGEAFAFTDEEVEHIRAADPTALREPVNESEDGAKTADADEIERVAREAQEEARKNGGATSDAANVARAAAKGVATRTNPNNNNRAEAPGPEADEESDAL